MKFPTSHTDDKNRVHYIKVDRIMVMCGFRIEKINAFALPFSKKNLESSIFIFTFVRRFFFKPANVSPTNYMAYGIKRSSEETQKSW